jgi:RNA polymerase sigma-70 factor (ECF subfamily)
VTRPDEDLLDAWREGDRDAGTELFRRYFPQVRRFFVNKIPERDVDDLLQKTFTAMVEGRERFRGACSFRTYVFSIARNVVMRYLRDFARRDSKHSPDMGVSSIAGLGLTPRTVIAARHEQEAVRVALQRIPVHFQEIIELSYWEGLGTTELAELLGVETTTVRTRLFRARKALAKVLEEVGLREDDKVEAAVTELGRVL